MSAEARLRQLLDERIVVLDGAWGTMLQEAGLADADYRGERFRDHPREVAGDPDLLNLTRPDVVLDVHRRYLAAGADVTTTNTFTATGIGQADYGLEDVVHELNVEGARLARQAADEAGGRFVAGSLGPLNVTLSLSPRVDEPAFRSVTFDEVKAAYAEQIAALAEGGVDLLLVETIFDTLNGKAAIAAAREVAPELPLWISVTIVDLSGRTLSGQTLEAFWASIEHAHPLLVGVNCSLGAQRDAAARRGARPARRLLHELSPERRAAERVRRLRRAAGRDVRAPARVRRGRLRERRRRLLRDDARARTRRIAAAVAGLPPRRVPQHRPRTRFSGLEPFEIGPDTGFVMIGERTNVTGSARFRRTIEAGDLQGAVDVALEQVRGGANLLDVNMDADLLDSERAITTFLNLIATEPEVARHPDHGRQLALLRHRGGAQVRPGQGDRQLDQPQGGGGAVPRAGAPDPGLRRRRRRHGLRRGGAGRDGRAQGRASASVRTGCSSRTSASRRRTSSSTRTCSRSRPASRSTTASRSTSSRRCR